MKWYYLFWAISLSLSEPYDTEAECVAALEKNIQSPGIIDPGFYNPPIKPGGICVQGTAR